jgi:predicted TIM-barrel fold metal-dependent hydrolase
VAALAESRGAGCLACAAIIGRADLRHPRCAETLAEMARCRNFAGLRFRPHRSDPDWSVDDPALRRGLAALQALGCTEARPAPMVLDVWERDTAKLPRLRALARAFPRLSVVMDHCGGLVGPRMPAAALAQWRHDLRLLVACPNIFAKVGGIQMAANGFALHERATPVGSEELCALTLPFYGTVIDCFGPSRCMFESNFPVDKTSCSYRVLWNSFKRVAAARRMGPAEKRDIFHDTAARAYGLPLLGDTAAAPRPRAAL